MKFEIRKYEENIIKTIFPKIKKKLLKHFLNTFFKYFLKKLYFSILIS